jgi:hypothetical protein
MDPHGRFFMFERDSSETMGGNGWDDVWYCGHFAWEHKGKRAKLRAAFEQLNLHFDSLENPPLLVVTDLKRSKSISTSRARLRGAPDRPRHLCRAGEPAALHHQCQLAAATQVLRKGIQITAPADPISRTIRVVAGVM